MCSIRIQNLQQRPYNGICIYCLWIYCVYSCGRCWLEDLQYRMWVAVTQVLQWLCGSTRRACASFSDNNVGMSSLPVIVSMCSTSCFASTTVLVTLPSILVVRSSVCCQLLNHLICTVFALPFVSMYFRMEEGFCTIFYGQLFHEFLQQNLLEQLSHLQVPWNFQRFAVFLHWGIYFGLINPQRKKLYVHNL